MKLIFWDFIQEGSRLKVDYEVNWDRDSFLENHRSSARSHVQERMGQLPSSVQYTRNEAPRHQSQIIHSVSDGPRTKRFRVGFLTLEVNNVICFVL